MSINMALYRYLMAHGATDTEAEQAASPTGLEAMATKGDVTALREAMATKAEIAEVRGELQVLRWMMGTLIVIAIGHFMLTINLISRLPR